MPKASKGFSMTSPKGHAEKRLKLTMALGRRRTSCYLDDLDSDALMALSAYFYRLAAKKIK